MIQNETADRSRYIVLVQDDSVSIFGPFASRDDVAQFGWLIENHYSDLRWNATRLDRSIEKLPIFCGLALEEF